MSNFKAVVLDLDGTLVDTNEYHVRAWLDTLAEYGYEPGYGEVRRLIGMGTDNFLPALVGLAEDDPKTEEIGDRRGEIFKTRYMPRARAFPRARELLERMKGEGLTLVAASSSTSSEVEKLLEKVGAGGLVESATSSTDAEHSKPDPDIVEAALEKAGFPPEQVVMIGDSPYDVEAAHKAGIEIIGLRCGGFSDSDLAGTITIYDDPADLLARFDDSPLAGRQR